MTSLRVESDAAAELSSVVVQLMKGVLYRDTHERHWQRLLKLRNQVSDHVAVLGLVVLVDEAEGYAYLRSRPDDDQDVPRLIARRSLSFHVSLLLALLRKKLAEFDALSAETRLVLTRDQIAEMLRLFLPETSNEVRLLGQIDTHINKVVELGFLSKLRGEDDLFEVRRILKAFVDGQWLADFDARLADYRAQLDGRDS
ncbi:MAG TPA: DUF4194 domain-containing protein [Propionibacteriaceae bacterium]|jgi:hypothetical protein